MSIEQVTEDFIGRDQEIAFFEQWLYDPSAPSVMYIHDALKEQEKKGGIGKTWLLHRFSEIATEQEQCIPVSIDFFNVADRDGVVVAERVAQALQERFPQWRPEFFQKILREYHKAAYGKVEETTNMREQLADAFADDLHLLRAQMSESNTSIILFFDTFELIELNPITAVLHSTHAFPDTYQSDRIRAVIAGRNALDWSRRNWVGREKEVIVRSLLPFNYDETLRYLRAKSYVCDIDTLTQETKEALYDRSEGRPILLGLVTDVLNKRIKLPEALIMASRGAFEASLVEEIHSFDDPSRWAIFSMAHIYHRFNAALLSLLINWPGLQGLVPEMQYQELLTELPALSFVRRSTSSDDFVLHDEMRRLVNKYCWEVQDPDKRIRRELSELAVEYYSDLIEGEAHDETRQSYIAEMLFHKLFINIDEGFDYFSAHFNDAASFSLYPFARALFQEAQKFVHHFSREQCWVMMMAEAKLLRGELNFKAALHIYQDLERDTQFVENNLSDLLFEMFNCYLQMSRFSEAISYIQACQELEKTNRDQTRYAKLLNSLGYISRRQGRHDDAMRYYEESLLIQRNLDNPKAYASTLNNMGNVLRYENKFEDALRYCKFGLRIRRDLCKQGKLIESYVGLSLSTIGHIYFALDEMIEVEKVFQEAFSIYSRVGDRRALAGAYNSLGQVHFKKGEWEKALEDFRQAARIASGISRESEINSLIQQGRVLAELGRWQESTDYLEHAVMLAREVGQNLQIAEGLLDLVTSLDHLGLSTDVQMREAKRIARKHNYYRLLGRAGEIQGDIFFRRQEYQRAFKHYRVACRYMTLQGTRTFERFLRRLNDVLLDLPSNVLPGAIDSLLEYWYDLGLEKEYPQLLRTCKGVIRHVIL